MAAEPHHRRWIKPLEDVVDRKHILVNLDCDSIIGALFIDSVVALFGISVGGKRSAQRHAAQPRDCNHRELVQNLI